MIKKYKRTVEAIAVQVSFETLPVAVSIDGGLTGGMEDFKPFVKGEGILAVEGDWLVREDGGPVMVRSAKEFAAMYSGVHGPKKAKAEVEAPVAPKHEKKSKVA